MMGHQEHTRSSSVLHDTFEGFLLSSGEKLATGEVLERVPEPSELYSPPGRGCEDESVSVSAS